MVTVTGLTDAALLCTPPPESFLILSAMVRHLLRLGLLSSAAGPQSHFSDFLVGRMDVAAISTALVL